MRTCLGCTICEKVIRFWILLCGCLIPDLEIGRDLGASQLLVSSSISKAYTFRIQLVQSSSPIVESLDSLPTLIWPRDWIVEWNPHSPTRLAYWGSSILQTVDTWSFCASRCLRNPRAKRKKPWGREVKECRWKMWWLIARGVGSKPLWRLPGVGMSVCNLLSDRCSVPVTESLRIWRRCVQSSHWPPRGNWIVGRESLWSLNISTWIISWLNADLWNSIYR